jgi:hypothetical protein
MAAEAALDAFVARTCQRADPSSGMSPHTYPRDVWAQLHEAEAQRKAAEWAKSVAGQKIDRLEREVVALRRELARLRVETFGGTVKQARAAGFRAPPGASDGATVAGLRELLLNATGDALGTVRAEIEERIAVLEQRPLDGAQIDFSYDGERGLTVRCGKASKIFTMPVMIYRDIYKEGAFYATGDVVSWSGSLWIAREDGFLKKPNLGNPSFRLACKAGRDARTT